MSNPKCSFASYDGNSFAIDCEARLQVSSFTQTPHPVSSRKPQMFFPMGEDAMSNTGGCAACWTSHPGDKEPGVGFQDFGELGGRCHLSMYGETRDLPGAAHPRNVPKPARNKQNY